MKCWLYLFAISALYPLSQGDVGDFSPCLKYFYKKCPPCGIEGTPICQNYDNKYRFATLYSRERRSPWFSAYLYSPTGKKPETDWMYEPQLADSNADGAMVECPRVEVDQNVIDSQAVDKDYKDSDYTRGHLNPSQHHQDRIDRRSTYTLTNVVPQKEWSNSVPWADMETHVNKTLSQYCLGRAHIVTGIIPYRVDRWLKEEHRVAIPEYLWSAYCCPSYSQNLPENLKEFFPTFAAIGRNDPTSTEEIVPKTNEKNVGYDVKEMSLAELEQFLKNRYNREITVFLNKCL